MTEGLKYIGLSFFSHKTATRAPERGLGWLFLAALLGILFLLFGLIAAHTLTFKANYRNAPQFTETVRLAFSDDGAPLTVKSGTLYADRIIDTVGNTDDKQNYSRGYDVILDTRPAKTYDDFTAYCVSDSGKEISYEQYLELDADVKTLYKFKIRYSGNERVIDGEWVQKCESYLDERTDDKTADAYAEVKKLSGDKYTDALYDLYIRSYYPSLTEYERDGSAPKTRNYYYQNYSDRKNTLFVFCDSMVGSFVTKTGAEQTFYGHYGKLDNGAIGTSAAAIDDFIVMSFKGASAMTVYNAIINFFFTMPFIILVAVAVIVIMFCMTKLLKHDELTFGAAAKTVCGFIPWSALFAGFVTFALGFLVSQSILSWLTGAAFFLVLAIRTAVMLTISSMAKKRAARAEDGKESDPSEPRQAAAQETTNGIGNTEDGKL